MESLREGIRSKYEAYHRLNPDRFPVFSYNTNRANYEPLRESFEEEFYVVRSIDRTSNTIHIPSTKTLASIFTDEDYKPGRRILDTCRSYAWGKSPTQVSQVPVNSAKNENPPGIPMSRRRLMYLAVCLGLIGLATVAVSAWRRSRIPENRLTVHYPAPNAVVPRRFLARGHVSDAHEVWIVVHIEDSLDYYVQRAVMIEPNGDWQGLVHAGRVGTIDVGRRVQMRVFINTNEPLEEEEVLYAWPKAEFASEVIDVVRGPTDR